MATRCLLAGYLAKNTYTSLHTYMGRTANTTGLAYPPAIVCLMTCQDLRLKQTAVRSKGTARPNSMQSKYTW
jgi:hypothetical protein